MTILAIAFPAEAAAPIAQAVVSAAAGAARPLIGIGVFATVLMLFKPLLSGMARTALLLVAPRKSLEQRVSEARLKSAFKLQKLARDYEASEPGLAAELRAIAARA